MEIKIEDVFYKNSAKKLNLTFMPNTISGIIEKNQTCYNYIFELLYGEKMPISGKISMGNNEISSETKINKIYSIRKNIFYLSEDFETYFFNINIKEDIKYRANCYDDNELMDLLNEFNLNKDILSKNHMELSFGEKKKIFLIIMILSKREILILENPDADLDYKAVQVLTKFLKKIKRENKIIILNSTNSDFLLNVCDRIIGINNNKVIVDSKAFDILSNKILTEKLNLNVPDIIDFVNEINNKTKFKLKYRTDINDLIKDIYRNVN